MTTHSGAPSTRIIHDNAKIMGIHLRSSRKRLYHSRFCLLGRTPDRRVQGPMILALACIQHLCVMHKSVSGEMYGSNGLHMHSRWHTYADLPVERSDVCACRPILT